MNIQVISLKNATKRRTHILNEFGKHDISFEFFDAITPDILNQVATTYNLNIHNNKNNMSLAELSCFFSHFCLWQMVIEQQLEAVAIFEDDIYLGDNAKKFLLDIQNFPQNFDLIKLEKTYDKIKIDLFYKEHCFDRTLLKLKDEHMGAGGYIISYHGAKKMIDFIKNNPIDHCDQLLFGQGLKMDLQIYQLSPALCIQDCILNPHSEQFPSHLQWRDKIIKSDDKKSYGIQKIKKELYRPYYQSRQLLMGIKKQTLTFK